MPDDVAAKPAAPPPVPVPAAAPQANEAVPAAAPSSGLSAAEERTLGELLAKQQASEPGGGSVRLKVEAPHSAMQFGGVTVGTEWTTVPERLVPHLFNQAATAGVTLTRES